MAAQQQQRANAQSALAANLSALQRNNNAANTNSMKRARNQSQPKAQQQQQQMQSQNNANLYKNSANAFKNFNPNLLSNNYQLAAATLAAANTQFLQQVVVSDDWMNFFCVIDRFLMFFSFSGSKTGYAKSSGRRCCRFELPLESDECCSCCECRTSRLGLIEVVQVEFGLNAKHFHYTSAAQSAAAGTVTASAEYEAGTKSQFEWPKESVCYL